MDIESKVNLCLFILAIILIYFFLSKSNIEGFSGTIDSTALQNVASIYNNKKLIVDELEVRGNLTTKGMLQVEGGSRFNGGRHFFKDSEKSDGAGLRIGAAWGQYGIYSENGPLVLGSQAGSVEVRGNINSNGSVSVNGSVSANGNINSNGSIMLKDELKFHNAPDKRVWRLYRNFDDLVLVGSGDKGQENWDWNNIFYFRPKGLHVKHTIKVGGGDADIAGDASSGQIYADNVGLTGKGWVRARGAMDNHWAWAR
jgi:hypothetical protein